MNVVNFKTESHFSLSLGPLFYILHVVLLKILFLAWGKYKPFLCKPAQETLYWDTHVMKFGKDDEAKKESDVRIFQRKNQLGY